MVAEKVGIRGFWDRISEDIIHDIEGNSEFHNDMCEYARKLEENDNADLDFKNFMLSIGTKGERLEPCKKRKEFADDINGYDTDGYPESEDDLHYQFFLENLKEYDYSYAVEYEEDGFRMLIPYGGDIDSDDDYSPERKLRSGTEQEHELLDQIPDVEIHEKRDTRYTSFKKMESRVLRSSMNQDKSQDMLNIGKCFKNKIVLDTDYTRFIQTIEIVDGHIVAKHRGRTIVYGAKNTEKDKAKEEFDDGDYSDVEILDSTSFYKMNGDGFQNRTSPSYFRQNLTAVLRKPYDREEHDRLWQDINCCKPEERSKDLRGGREYKSRMKLGKSYLDRYPDLRMLLLKSEDDESKCLNILRGFFFWLKNLGHDKSFIPWKDEECLSIRPGFS